jgi:hypothetical protein
MRPSSGLQASTKQVNPTRDPSAVVAIRRTPSNVIARPRSSSQHRPSPSLAHREVTPKYSETAVSEPAYSRLRLELARKRRGASEEPEAIGDAEAGGGVMRALKGRLPSR